MTLFDWKPLTKIILIKSYQFFAEKFVWYFSENSQYLGNYTLQLKLIKILTKLLTVESPQHLYSSLPICEFQEASNGNKTSANSAISDYKMTRGWKRPITMKKFLFRFFSLCLAKDQTKLNYSSCHLILNSGEILLRLFTSQKD